MAKTDLTILTLYIFLTPCLQSRSFWWKLCGIVPKPDVSLPLFNTFLKYSSSSGDQGQPWISKLSFFLFWLNPRRKRHPTSVLYCTKCPLSHSVYSLLILNPTAKLSFNFNILQPPQALEVTCYAIWCKQCWLELFLHHCVVLTSAIYI